MVAMWKYGLRRILLWGLGLAILGLLATQQPKQEPPQLVRPADAQAAQMAHQAVQRRFREDLLLIQRTLHSWPEGKPKAAIFVLARNSEAEELARSLQELEASFNGREEARYPCAWSFARVCACGLVGGGIGGRAPRSWLLFGRWERREGPMGRRRGEGEGEGGRPLQSCFVSLFAPLPF